VGQNKQDLESAVIEYTANSRGFYQKITIQNQMVLISKDRSGKAKAVATKIAADDWEELVVCFKKIELDNLSKLKAPTEKRFMTVRQLLLLKSRLKMKPINHQVLIMVFQKNIEQFVNKINSFVKQKMKIKEIQDEIVDEFSMFDDWMERYEYIIQLGKSLPLIKDEFKTDSNVIKGQSKYGCKEKTR
jgi:hypothetical protein